MPDQPLGEVEDIEETIPEPSRDIDDAPLKARKRQKHVRNAEKSADSPSPKKKKSIQMALDTPHPAPANWREAYDKIKEMRQMYVAPVDTMGCATAQLREIDPKVCFCNDL